VINSKEPQYFPGTRLFKRFQIVDQGDQLINLNNNLSENEQQRTNFLKQQQ